MKITVPEKGNDVVSHSVMDREVASPRVGVQHILIAWKELVDIYGSRMDQRAAQRSFGEARSEIRSILKELRANNLDWKRLLRQHSEDPVAARGKIYEVFPKAKLTRPFRMLSLRLHLNEVAVVNTKFGFHIIRRME